ncbi:MAG: threonine ammonia-lyase [Deltaproteobacteria bacterium]|nr:threonine ammonia-lyase [Deltaproteobacteria bacterium]
MPQEAMNLLIRQAEQRLKPIVSPTPIVYSSSLTTLFGFESFLKLENLQKTGSFKVRGAYNKIASLSPDDMEKGVITASSGNHAQGVAWAASMLGVKAKVVMPESAPIIKRMATKGYGAEVVLHGRSFDDACARAREIRDAEGSVFIPAFDDELIIAGQGTIGLEIIADVTDIDAVIVPIGGGGLISGIASAVKESNPRIKVIGVQAVASPSCLKAIEAGRPLEARALPTIADGIAVKRIGEITFPLIKRYVDEVICVSEEAIAGAILRLMERKKLVVEGAGAIGVGAAMEGKLPKGIKKVVFVLSGGNIDVTTLDRVIRLGLVKEGRVMRLSTIVPDVPGSLAALTSEIAGLKANILHVAHQNYASGVPIGSTLLEITLEVEDALHSQRVMTRLKEAGYKAERIG